MAGQPEPEPENSTGVPYFGPEPGPEWDLALPLWAHAWPVHTYFFASCFLVVFMAAVVNLTMAIIIRKRSRHKKWFSIALTAMVGCLALPRFLHLFIDPYGGKKIFPPLLNTVFYSLAWPAITTIYNLVLGVIYESTRMQVGPAWFQKPAVIIFVCIFHYSLVFGGDIIAYHAMEAKYVVQFCQGFFTIYNFGMALALGVLAHRLRKNLSRGGGLQEGVKVLLIVVGLATDAGVICAAHVYATFGVFGVTGDVRYVEAWPWWFWMTFLRVTELVVALLTLVLVRQRTADLRPAHTSLHEYPATNPNPTAPNPAPLAAPQYPPQSPTVA